MKAILPLLLLGSVLVLGAQETPPAEPASVLEARCTRSFGDNAVFQQNMPVPVWGWSLPQAKVDVAFDKQTRSTTAGAGGAWRVTLDPMPADKLKSVNEAPAGRSLAIPDTGMAVTMDIGDKKEHPINKHDIGLLLARWALHRDYGRKDLIPSGPLYQSHKIEGNTIRVSFQYAEKGLMLANKDGYNPPVPTPGAPIPWLSIQTKDGTWHWAEGEIEGSDLIVSNKDVKAPIAARYAYTHYPTGFNLYNKDGLPASPFTTCGY